jgi:hypothetical protein
LTQGNSNGKGKSTVTQICGEFSPPHEFPRKLSTRACLAFCVGKFQSCLDIPRAEVKAPRRDILSLLLTSLPFTLRRSKAMKNYENVRHEYRQTLECLHFRVEKSTRVRFFPTVAATTIIFSSLSASRQFIESVDLSKCLFIVSTRIDATKTSKRESNKNSF